MEDIILASASPRRRELLEQIGIPYRVMPSFKEEKIEGDTPPEIVQRLARGKAEDVAIAMNLAGKLVLGADTIVVWNNQILGKPKSEEEAFHTLSDLQGNTHQVYTGVALMYVDAEGRLQGSSFYEETQVEVYSMSEEEIRAYLATKDYADKAGAYGIQGAFGAYIKGIRGEYSNVVGLPVGRLYQELKKINLELEKKKE
ncbi:MAG: Maf family protein [Lachnospiraceae bacterium]